MSVKLKYTNSINELEPLGQLDETTSLGTNEKGKLVQSTGDFIGLGFEEEDDILYAQPGILPSDGTFASPYQRYLQTDISVEARELATKDGNRFAQVIRRAPNVGSGATWGGISLFPDSVLMRKSNNRFRFSFDYRGYSNGNQMEVYQSFTIGWSDYGVGLPTVWYNPVPAFDTDWEWRHYKYEFTVTDAFLNVVAGTPWSSTTQYPASGYYAVTYNGDLYRHNNTGVAPTLGVNPATEYALNNGTWTDKWVGGAAPGYFNVYQNMKIGFNYEAQTPRGTHVHVDNITLTNITTNEKFKYDLTTNVWISENLADSGFDILAKGTAYVGQARTDNGADVFAVEGNRFLSVNGVSAGLGNSRGLMLTILNSSGGLISSTNYDVYSGGADNTNLANALAGVGSSNYWVLTSFDAIGDAATHNATPALRNQLIAMGSRMWNPAEGVLYLWNPPAASDVRNTYAAVGKGQQLIKEDGSAASDTIYKRKAVIQTRIS